MFLWLASEGACKCLQLPRGYLRFPLSLLQLSWMSEHTGIQYGIRKLELNREGEEDRNMGEEMARSRQGSGC